MSEPISESVELRVGERTFSFPIERGSEGYPAINIAALRGHGLSR